MKAIMLESASRFIPLPVKRRISTSLRKFMQAADQGNYCLCACSTLTGDSTSPARRLGVASVPMSRGKLMMQKCSMASTIREVMRGDAQIFAVAAFTITNSELDQARLCEERRNHVAESMKA